MILKSLTLSGIFLALIACSSDDEQEVNQVNLDFDALCGHYAALVDLPEYTALSSEDRAVLLEAVLAKGLSRSSNAYIAWTAIRSGPASERHFLFKEAADSVGYKQWNCSAIKKHGHEIGSGS